MTIPGPDLARTKSGRGRSQARAKRPRARRGGARGLLKLHSARTSDEFWKATQLLIEEAAPSPSRWLCLRPVRMATALRLLRETRRPWEFVRFGNCGRRMEGVTSDEEEAALLKAVFARHPAISHFRSNPLVSMVHLPALRRSDRNEANFVHRWRWRFGVALAFWRKAQLEGVLLLHREESDGDYTSNERERLGQLHSQLEKALCRIISGRRQEAEKKALASILKPLPLPLVLCDWRLRIICESADGLKARAAWELGEDRARSMIFSPQRKLPPELAEFCRARIMMWEKAGPRRRRLLEKEELEMRHPLRPQVRVYVRLAREKTVPMIRPFFFLRFETQSAEDQGRQIRADNLASLAQLSAAERELALLVCRGHSNGAIAQQLGKSVYTIKAQLHSIFAKLKVQRRSQLVALLIRTSVPLLACFSFDLFDALISGV